MENGGAGRMYKEQDLIGFHLNLFGVLYFDQPVPNS